MGKGKSFTKRCWYKLFLKKALRGQKVAAAS